MLTRSLTLSRILNALLVWTVLFPFIPSVVPASDTQPTFLLVLLISLLAGFAISSIGSVMFRMSFSGVTLAAISMLAVYALLIIANSGSNTSTLPSRLFSFAQFAAVALWAYAGKYEWNNKTLYNAMLVYCVFTVLYFATGGLIENLLIQSRVAASASLFESGRGARTLSPEPSFFALQVFNIYVLSRVVNRWGPAWHGEPPLFVALVVACLVASFSAYAALVLLVVLSVKYPKTLALATIGVISAASVFYTYLSHWGSIRAIKVVLAVVKSNGSVAKLFLLDASLASRIHSFTAYVSSFGDHPWFGNGFSLYQGGGFISIVAAFGVSAMVFFAWMLARTLRGPLSISTKVLLIVWFVLNFVSGPVGVPIIGLIAGKVLAAGHRTTRRGPSPKRLIGAPRILAT